MHRARGEAPYTWDKARRDDARHPGAADPEPEVQGVRLPVMNPSPRRIAALSALSALAAVLVLTAVACGGGTGGSAPAPTPALSPSPAPTPGALQTVTELKLALVTSYGPLWYCDPDFYPIQREDEIASAKERWPEVTADAAAFKSIAAANQVDPAGQLTDPQMLAVYRTWKVLRAIALDASGDGYRFDYLAQPKPGAAEGTRSTGTISASGVISIEQQTAAMEPICPICLARGVRIDTPSGREAVEALQIGDPIWTLDTSGHRIDGIVLAVGSARAPLNHRVVHLVLADGRSVTASPGHPLGDGRPIGAIRLGDLVAGSVVVSADLVPYDGGRTFDIVVSGPTGTYLVDGIPLGSTLQP